MKMKCKICPGIREEECKRRREDATEAGKVGKRCSQLQ